MFVRGEVCFVSGHDFSRAAQELKDEGFSPCTLSAFHPARSENGSKDPYHSGESRMLKSSQSGKDRISGAKALIGCLAYGMTKVVP